MEIKMIYRTFFSIILVQTCYSITRKLSVEDLSNHADSDCEHYLPLHLVRADGPNDSIIYLWSFIYNPSVLIALTLPSTNVNITWPGISPLPPDSLQHDPNEKNKCNPESTEFSSDPTFSYGLSIQKVIEFNDVNDSGNMNSYSSENINVLNTKYFKWRLYHKKVSHELIELEIVGDSYFDPDTKIQRKGDITFLASVFGTLNRFIQKPSMLHSENATQIDLKIDKFETNRTFTNSRFAIEVLLVSEGNPNSSFSIINRKNIDDEHTPGVFKVVEIKTPPMKLPHRDENVGMYLEWRPISYTTDVRDVTDSSEVIYYPLQKSQDPYSDAYWSIFYSYYSTLSKNNLSNIIVQKMNVSFGVEDDPFYKKTGYASWTFLCGYSSSLDEQITSLTMLIFSLVIAIPLLPIIFYGSFILYRRIFRRDNEFRRS